MDTRFYPNVEIDIASLGTELQRLFDAEGYEVQKMHVSHTTVIQARRTGTWRDVTGLSAAITIKLTAEASGTRIEIGMQKWMDKAAVAAVAVIITQPWLLALPALGMYWQNKTTEQAGEIIETHIAQQAGGYVPPRPGNCGTCGATIINDAAFCSNCGSDLRTHRQCQSCGARQREPSARFCHNCGKPVT